MAHFCRPHARHKTSFCLLERYCEARDNLFPHMSEIWFLGLNDLLDFTFTIMQIPLSEDLSVVGVLTNPLSCPLFGVLAQRHQQLFW